MGFGIFMKILKGPMNPVCSTAQLCNDQKAANLVPSPLFRKSSWAVPDSFWKITQHPSLRERSGKTPEKRIQINTLKPTLIPSYHWYPGFSFLLEGREMKAVGPQQQCSEAFPGLVLRSNPWRCSGDIWLDPYQTTCLDSCSNSLTPSFSFGFWVQRCSGFTIGSASGRAHY